MGEVYYRVIFGVEKPRIGLLSIGEEEHKGNDLTREAFGLLKQLPFNFVGNVEGRDLYNGRVEVIVCDGFIGNVALKISEGLVETISSLLERGAFEHHPRQGRLRPVPPRLPEVQETRGLFGVRRRPSAGSAWRMHYLPRTARTRTRSRTPSAWRRDLRRAR